MANSRTIALHLSASHIISGRTPSLGFWEKNSMQLWSNLSQKRRTEKTNKVAIWEGNGLWADRRSLTKWKASGECWKLSSIWESTASAPCLTMGYHRRLNTYGFKKKSLFHKYTYLNALTILVRCFTRLGWSIFKNNCYNLVITIVQHLRIKRRINFLNCSEEFSVQTSSILSRVTSIRIVNFWTAASPFSRAMTHVSTCWARGQESQSIILHKQKNVFRVNNVQNVLMITFGCSTCGENGEK